MSHCAFDIIPDNNFTTTTKSIWVKCGETTDCEENKVRGRKKENSKERKWLLVFSINSMYSKMFLSSLKTIGKKGIIKV